MVTSGLSVELPDVLGSLSHAQILWCRISLHTLRTRLRRHGLLHSLVDLSLILLHGLRIGSGSRLIIICYYSLGRAMGEELVELWTPVLLSWPGPCCESDLTSYHCSLHIAPHFTSLRHATSLHRTIPCCVEWRVVLLFRREQIWHTPHSALLRWLLPP